MASDLEQKLCKALRDHPYKFSNRYDDKARVALIEVLFRSLTNDRPDYLSALFPSGFPESYTLRDAQGAAENTEYTEAARGHRCGHIFKQGEAAYHCMTCSDDPTCVLCSRCFDASDHESHQFHINASAGNSGCCDCGDPEAWKRQVNCAIHTASQQPRTHNQPSPLPPDLVSAIRTTIGRVLDYFCDIISCAPEQMRLPKVVEVIERDESLSRLGAKWYGEADVLDWDAEYCLMVWNDEKHTEVEVSDAIKRACRQTQRFGDAKAREANDFGRSILRHSRNPIELLKMSSIIESIQVTTTIRTSRDTFREQMCGTIVEWLADIAGCSVGDDHSILRYTICREMLQPWRVGSKAYNARIGTRGIDDHECEENMHPFAPVPESEQGAMALVELAVNEDDDEEMRDLDRDIEVNAMEFEASRAANAQEDAQAGRGTSLSRQMDDLRMNRSPNRRNDIAPEVSNRMEVSQSHDRSEEGNGQAARSNFHFHSSIDFSPRIGSDAADDTMPPQFPITNYQTVPSTPYGRRKLLSGPQPSHWAIQPSGAKNRPDLPAHEDLAAKIRLDSMIMFDMRMWKKARTDLRDLYISTVVNVPDFKRILGLRFSGLYTSISQLYLIADREPDHSIINLSLQMLTSTSITEEVIERGNFLTNLMAIIYTFLTSRQVGFPQDVSSTAYLAFDTGSVTNRRLYHFFSDLRYFLSSEAVQRKVAQDKQYLLQFLDLVKLSQGICPNVRAVGEHLEYETDAWIGASILTREINKLCRQFSEAFSTRKTKRNGIENSTGAIYTCASATIFHSVGLERQRFDQCEIKEVARFKELKPFEFECTVSQGKRKSYRVIDFALDKGSVAFHHALHYTLSWLIEGGKSISNAELRATLSKAGSDFIRQHGPLESSVQGFHDPEDALLAVYDFPLRVCAWLAQMKAGLWVRNGMSLRHQMSQYRAVTFRDVAYHRDIFLLQTAFVTCEPSRVLATMIDRYGLDHWMRGLYNVGKVFEDLQVVDLVEDFISLLIVVLSDRGCLITLEDEPEPLRASTRKDIIHTLCFKPLSFSELNAKLVEKVQEYQCLHNVLDEMTIFHPPEGLTDVGTFELKSEYLEELDPFNTNYSKSQREEVESIYRRWMSKKLGKSAEEIVLQPRLRPIRSGVFSNLASFTRTPLFAQVIYFALDFAIVATSVAPAVPAARIESLLHVVLQLALVAALEDSAMDESDLEASAESFIHHALLTKSVLQPRGHTTIVECLRSISHMDQYASCRLKIKHLLKLFYRKRAHDFERATVHLDFPYGRLDTPSPANADQDLEAKKKQALARKAKVMAQFQQQQQSFMDNHGMSKGLDDELSDTEMKKPVSCQKGVWRQGGGVCILCQEETNDARIFGTFGMLTHSNLLRQTELDDADWVREVLCTPPSLDHPVEHIRPFGVAGDNHEQIVRLTATGDQISKDRQGLGKGWPSDYTRRSALSSGCGHLMHYACFQPYFQSLVKRHENQVARHHPERTENYEFVCPLCKALGNAFLPIVRDEKVTSCTGTFAKGETLEDFLGYVSDRIDATQEAILHNKYAFAPTGRSSQAPFRPRFSETAANAESSSRSATSPSKELSKVFTRLEETIHINRLDQVQVSPSSAQTTPTLEVLLSLLSSSVSAVEIAHRGVGAGAGETSSLERTVTPALLHLRVLAETISSYMSFGESARHSFKRDLSLVQQRIFGQLFPTSAFRMESETEQTAQANTNSNAAPLFLQDLFDIFTQSCLILSPVLDINVYHLLQLCYLAHISQIVLAYMYNQKGLLNLLEKLGRQKLTFSSMPPTSLEVHALSQFSGWINDQLIADGYAPSSLPAGSESVVFALVRSHSLAFLRKAIIFLKVYDDVDLSTSSIDGQSPEIDRLSRSLQLPTLHEIMTGLEPPHGNVSTQNVLAGWVRAVAAHEYEDQVRREGFTNVSSSGISVNVARNMLLHHPAPLELIGLPKYFDVLMEEAHRRKCPTTGRDLTDPALCLFCGTVLCMQAYCCMNDKSFGPANLHVLRCSSPIGVFLSIRKCTVLILHVVSKPARLPSSTRTTRTTSSSSSFPSSPHNAINNGGPAGPRHGSDSTDAAPTAATTAAIPSRPTAFASYPTSRSFTSSGSWLHAPYLTRHGEVDPGLRQRHQLILSQKRYDRLLRDVWLMLNGNLWSTVARKLEGEVNSGGWETL